MHKVILINCPVDEVLVENINEILGVKTQLHSKTDTFFKLKTNASINTDLAHEALKNLLYPHKIDYIITNDVPKKLILCDMDMTLVECESLDFVAEYAGVRGQVEEITQRAMNGEIPFEEAIIERIRLLKGISVDAFEQIVPKIPLSKGAKELANRAKMANMTRVIVSGGFVNISYPIRERLEFTSAYSNEFEIQNGVLTGNLKGCLLDDKAKLEKLKTYSHKLGLTQYETVAVGDGSNDILMLKEADLSVAFHAKPIVKAHIQNQINFSGLEVLSYLL
jgi:phosphoserine phosphatase